MCIRDRNKDKQILAWYYALPHFRYGSWGALLTVRTGSCIGMGSTLLGTALLLLSLIHI